MGCAQPVLRIPARTFLIAFAPRVDDIFVAIAQNPASYQRKNQNERSDSVINVRAGRSAESKLGIHLERL